MIQCQEARNAFKLVKESCQKSVPDSQSTGRCCAEMKLIGQMEASARRHGVAKSGVVRWVRRKLGSHLTIVRYLADGRTACAVPCIFCRRLLVSYDLVVHCSLSDFEWNHDSMPKDRSSHCMA